MSVIGEATLSVFLELLRGKLLNSALNFSILPDIQAVLTDAEEKQIKNEGVKKWLDDLQDLAYDVDDILDEFAYEELPSTSKVRKLIPTCCTSSDFTPTSFLFKNSMIPKVKEITDRLNSDTSNGVSVLSIVGMRGMGKTTLAQLVYNDATINQSFDLKAWVCVSDNFDAIAITKAILQSITSESCDYSNLDLLQVKLKEKLSGKRFLLVLDDIWNENYNDWTILRSPFGAGTAIIVTTRLQIVSSIVDPLKAFHLDKLSDDDCLSIFTQHALKAINFDGHPHFKEIGEKIIRRCNGLPLAAKAIGSLLRTSEIWNLPEEQCGIIPTLLLSYHHLPSYLKRCFAYCSILPKDYEFEEEEIILFWRAEGLLQQKAMPQVKDIGNQYFQDLVSRSFFQISSKDESRFVMHDLINDLAQSDKQQKFSHRTRHSSYIAGSYDTVKKFEAFDQVNSIRTFLPIRLSRYSRSLLTNVVLVDLLPKLGYLRFPDVFENLKHLRFLNFSYTRIRCLPDSLCTLYHLETLLLKKCSKLQKLPSKMEKLVNLQYLDIRGANLIERMPFGIGEGDGHSAFCLSGLQNVKGEDAGEAKLNEKQGIDRLVLKWSWDFKKDTRKKEVEDSVLDSLHPSKKLEQLVIENYDSSFKNMLSLELHDYKNCKSLPSIGRLLLLKDLSISGLDQVHKIGAELFGENQSNAFASLESLSFRKMLNWEEWDVCEDDEQVSKFPSLRFLSIRECPLLLGRLPTILQSLQNLQIYECKKLVVSISGFPLLSEISVEGCKELVDEGSLSVQKVTSLKYVSLSNISKFNISAEKIMLRFANFETFYISGWKELGSLSQNGLSIVRHRFIMIRNCPQLVSLETEEEIVQLEKIPAVKSLEEIVQLEKIPAVKSLVINNCERLNRLPKVLHAFPFITRILLKECPGLVCFTERNFPPALKELRIENCVNLQYLVDEKENNNKSMSSNICLLEHLQISYCPSLIWLSSRGDICNRLQHLEIGSCPKLISVFSNAKLPVMLKHLVISECPVLECIAQDFLETTDLEILSIRNAEKLKSLPRGLDKLSHLQEIKLFGCPNLVSFEESGLPTTNLRVLRISNCENFGALPKCINNFTSLRDLELRECSADISFPEEGFPTNLTSLEISNVPRIYTSLVEWGFNRLTSLQLLNISCEGCSRVVSFPKEAIGMMLPPSLTDISISRSKNLEFICSKGLQHLTSLQRLGIYGCPKLASLPEKDMLLSLEELYISNCPLLEEGCSRGKGREWSKISHIPLVEINHKTVIPRGLYGNLMDKILYQALHRINGGIQYMLQHGIREVNLTHVRQQSSQNIVLSNLKDIHLSKRPNGTTGEVYVPLGDKALNGGHPKRAIPAYGHNNGTTW
ncbi:hypothetical protein V6Z12_A11G369900 [Gossypium hirsutum]